MRNHKMRLIGGLAALVALALAVSCKGFFPPAQLNSITIVPSNATVPLNGTTQMHAFGVNIDGTQAGDVTNKVSWSSDSAAIPISATGLLTGESFTSTPANITANYQALPVQTATASVCVQGGTNFLIAPANTTVSASFGFPSPGGYTASLDAQVEGTNQTLDVTAVAVWTSSNTAVLNITGGTSPTLVLLTAPSSGTATPVTVTASYTCNGLTLTQQTITTVTN
jgi:hypothetical protein